MSMWEKLTSVMRKGRVIVQGEAGQALGVRQGDKMTVSTHGERSPVQHVGSITDMTFGSLHAKGHGPHVHTEREVAMEEMATNAAAEGRYSSTSRQ